MGGDRRRHASGSIGLTTSDRSGGRGGRRVFAVGHHIAQVDEVGSQYFFQSDFGVQGDFMIESDRKLTRVNIVQKVAQHFREA